MRHLPLLLLLATGTAAADKRAPIKNGTYPEHQKAWTKFVVLGSKLGAPLEKQPGFTCGPPPGTDGFSTQNHSCVKFVDARCKGKPTKITHIVGQGDVPKGQSCFMDEFSGATYLDREFMSPPLQSVRLVGTDTTSPLIFRIEYTFAADDLTRASNLGKALIAKYGTPSFENPPMQMSWSLDDVKASASCRTIGGESAPAGEYCTLRIEDEKLEQTERSIQEQANDAARTSAAPAPPPL